jgi:hypothetical protein
VTDDIPDASSTPDGPADLVARGSTADLHRRGTGWVVKLFHEGVPIEAVSIEHAAGVSAHASSLPVPAVGDLVDIDGRFGFEMEEVSGRTLAELLLAGEISPLDAGRQAADVQRAIHAHPAAELRDNSFWRATIAACPHLDVTRRRRLVEQLDAMPGPDGMCHGDFHAGNVLVAADRMVAIDLGAAHRGNTMSDVAQTVVAMTEWLYMPSLESVREPIEAFLAAYKTRVVELHPRAGEMASWQPIVAAVRLGSPHPSSSRQPLLDLVAAGLDHIDER